MRYVVIVLGIALCACESAPPIESPPPGTRLDAAVPMDKGVVVDLDRGPTPDVPLPDAAPDGPDPDANESDVVVTDGPITDAPPPDFGLPEDRPSPDRSLVLSSRQAAVFAWVQGGRLFAATLPRGEVAFGPTRDLIDAPFVDRLKGGATRGGQAWIVLPDGPEGELRAYNVALDAPEPQALGIWGPSTVIEADNSVVVYGRASADTGAGLAWRALGAATAGERFESARGTPAPSAAASALSQRMLAFDDGSCRSFVGDSEGGAWYCAARGRDVLIGDSNDLFIVGQFGPDVVAWTAAPGVNATPEAPVPEDGDAGLPDGGPDGGADVERRVVLADNTQLLYVLGRVGDATAFTFRRAGRDEIWLVGPGTSRSAEIDDPDGVYGFALLGAQPQLIEWPAGFGGPQSRIAVLTADIAPPTYETPDGCLGIVQPEDCSDADRDCTGAARNGLCCGESDIDSGVTLAVQEVPQGEWFVGSSASGLLIGMVLEIEGARHEARLFTQAVGSNGPALDEKAIWPDVRAIHAFANFQVRTVMLAELDPPPENPEGDRRVQLLIYVGRAGEAESQYAVPSPCSVEETRLLEVLPADNRVRIYCAERYYDVDPIAGTTLDFPYPEDLTAQWITRWAQPNDPTLLVATGDEHSVGRWRRQPDGALQAVAGAPRFLAELAEEERRLPIQLQATEGLPSRSRSGTLEVLVDGAGWRPAPSTRWPIAARTSAHTPLAISTGYLTDPEIPEEPARVGFFVHDLRLGGSAWGRPIDLNNATLATSHRGHAVGRYRTIEGPLWYRARGSQDVRIEGYEVQCEPR